MNSLGLNRELVQRRRVEVSLIAAEGLKHDRSDRYVLNPIMVLWPHGGTNHYGAIITPNS